MFKTCPNSGYDGWMYSAIWEKNNTNRVVVTINLSTWEMNGKTWRDGSEHNRKNYSDSRQSATQKRQQINEE